MLSRFYLLSATFILISACANKSHKSIEGSLDLPAADNSKAPAISVFDSPESVHWHPESRTWFVSSMGGQDILAKDGNGWITRLDENGKVISARWLHKGLNAPAGVAHIGNELYVAEREGLVVIDINKAEIVKTIELPGVQFANDAATDKEGNVYVSDNPGNKIYRWKKGMEKAEVWLEGADLDTPNGLHAEGNKLYFVTWGPGTRLGYLRSIDIPSKKISKGSGVEIGNMDGVIFANNTLYATDWMGGRLLKFDKKEKPTVWISGLSRIADPGYAPELKKLAIPEMSTNRVYFIDVK